MFLYIDLPRFDFPVVFSEPASTPKVWTCCEIDEMVLTGGPKHAVNFYCTNNGCSNTRRTRSPTLVRD